MNLCSKCGSPFEPESKYCTFCGSFLEGSDALVVPPIAHRDTDVESALSGEAALLSPFVGYFMNSPARADSSEDRLSFGTSERSSMYFDFMESDYVPSIVSSLADAADRVPMISNPVDESDLPIWSRTRRDEFAFKFKTPARAI